MDIKEEEIEEIKPVRKHNKTTFLRSSDVLFMDSTDIESKQKATLTKELQKIFGVNYIK